MMNFPLEFLAVFINLAYLGAMYALQLLDEDLPSRHSIIPGTNQKFIYMQDFYTFAYGDVLGISAIASGFAHLVKNGYVSIHLWINAIIMGIICTLLFSKKCFSVKHKPDMGFPSHEKMSWMGAIHFPYFFIGIMMSFTCLWDLIIGKLVGPFLWITLAGGIFYLLCCMLDIKSGNFDSIKTI